VRPYTDLDGFEAVVLEESYVFGIKAIPGAVTFKVEFALTPEHPAYAPPRSGETECFRTGRVRFINVERLVWEDQGAPPATDASGEIDYGHIDSFTWDGMTFKLEGDWGRMELTAAGVEVEVAR
jgi:hypothetical protein